jgi:phosphosulfolactate phosphohydrolase-like enzyme
MFGMSGNRIIRTGMRMLKAIWNTLFGNWKLIAIVAALSFAGGNYTGWKLHSWKNDAELANAIKDHLDAEKKANDAASAYENKKSKIEKKIKEEEKKRRTKFAEGDYIKCIATDDGVRLYQSITGTGNPG